MKNIFVSCMHIITLMVVKIHTFSVARNLLPDLSLFNIIYFCAKASTHQNIMLDSMHKSTMSNVSRSENMKR